MWTYDGQIAKWHLSGRSPAFLLVPDVRTVWTMKSSYASLEEAVLAIDDRRTERPFRCHAHDDTQASASVNITKGVWVCYACHAAGRMDGTIVETDFGRAREDIFALLDEGTDHQISEAMIGLYTAGTHEYWKSRFSDAAIEHFQLGTDPVSGRPCYPLRDTGGELLGMVMRNLDRQPKYRYPTGIKVHHLLWNYTQDTRKEVVLHEGAMDVIAAWEVGVESFGIFGSHLSVQQVEKLRRLSPRWVHLAFDNDEAGRRCTQQARAVLEDDGFLVNELDWRTYPFYKDVAELPERQRRNTLHRLLAV